MNIYRYLSLSLLLAGAVTTSVKPMDPNNGNKPTFDIKEITKQFTQEMNRHTKEMNMQLDKRFAQETKQRQLSDILMKKTITDTVDKSMKALDSNTLRMNYNKKIILKIFEYPPNQVFVIIITGILASTYYMRYKQKKKYELLTLRERRKGVN